jgi:two-component system response regulator RegX3
VPFLHHVAAAPYGAAAEPALGWMSGSVLIADADARGRDVLATALRREGLSVEAITDGRLAVERAATGGYALIIVDLDAPGLNGHEGCRRIRYESDVPLMILSGQAAEVDLVLGLEAGADAFLAKPVPITEAVCRVRAILRRRHLDLGPGGVTRRVGEIEVDLAGHRVLVAGRPVRLTPTEFRLLALLAQRPGRPVAPREILRELWQTDYVGAVGACKAHVSNLRRKLEDDPAAPRRIVTVPGAGYALVAPD